MKKISLKFLAIILLLSNIQVNQIKSSDDGTKAGEALGSIAAIGLIIYAGVKFWITNINEKKELAQTQQTQTKFKEALQKEVSTILRQKSGTTELTEAQAERIVEVVSKAIDKNKAEFDNVLNLPDNLKAIGWGSLITNLNETIKEEFRKDPELQTLIAGSTRSINLKRAQEGHDGITTEATLDLLKGDIFSAVKSQASQLKLSDADLKILDPRINTNDILNAEKRGYEVAKENAKLRTALGFEPAQSTIIKSQMKQLQDLAVQRTDLQPLIKTRLEQLNSQHFTETRKFAGQYGYSDPQHAPMYEKFVSTTPRLTSAADITHPIL